MRNVAKVALAVVAVALGAVGAKVSMDACYRVTAYSGGRYVQKDVCVPRGQKLKLKGETIVSAEPILIASKIISLAGEADGFECACPTMAAPCEMLRRNLDGKEEWVPAAPGLMLSPGRHRGAGCYPKNCVELLGKAVWPKECKT